MNLFWAALIVVGTTLLAIAAMLFVRRSAPEGSYFADGDRASGVFGVLATGFAILAGFVVFLAFESYDASRRAPRPRPGWSRSSSRSSSSSRPRKALGCPASSSATRATSPRRVEWPEMAEGDRHQPLERGDVPLHAGQRAPFGFRAGCLLEVARPASDREMGGRPRPRCGGRDPTSLWIVLFLTASIIFAYMLFFADSGEGRIVQAMLIGGVAVVISSLAAAPVVPR